MIDKIKSFVKDPETIAIAKSAFITVAVSLTVACAVEIVKIGAVTAIDAVGNLIENAKKD